MQRNNRSESNLDYASAVCLNRSFHVVRKAPLQNKSFAYYQSRLSSRNRSSHGPGDDVGLKKIGQLDDSSSRNINISDPSDCMFRNEHSPLHETPPFRKIAFYRQNSFSTTVSDISDPDEVSSYARSQNQESNDDDEHNDSIQPNRRNSLRRCKTEYFSPQVTSLSRSDIGNSDPSLKNSRPHRINPARGRGIHNSEFLLDSSERPRIMGSRNLLPLTSRRKISRSISSSTYHDQSTRFSHSDLFANQSRIQPYFSNASYGTRNDSDTSSSYGAPLDIAEDVEVSPGLHMRLRGSAETQQAIKDGFFMSHQCCLCRVPIFCIQDAEYIICPHCKVVDKIDLQSNPKRNVLNRSPDNAGGVGLGFSIKEISSIRMQVGRN